MSKFNNMTAEEMTKAINGMQDIQNTKSSPTYIAAKTVMYDVIGAGISDIETMLGQAGLGSLSLTRYASILQEWVNEHISHLDSIQ